MRLYRTIKIVMLLLFVLVSLVSGKIFDGIWKNELNSTMHIKITGNNINGWYDSSVGGVRGRFPLKGWMVSSSILSWQVNWVSAVEAVTSWNGYYNAKTKLIHTTWQETRNTGAFWNSTIDNEDIFIKV